MIVGDGALFLEEGVVAVGRGDADEARRSGRRVPAPDVGGGDQLVAVHCNEGGGHGDGRGVDAVEVDGFRQAAVGGGAHARACCSPMW